MTDQASEPLFGRNPVLELLRAESRRVDEIAILSEGRGPALQELLTLARRRGVKISYRTRDQLTAIAGTPHHQGVVARVAEAAYVALGDLLRIPRDRGEPAFFLALDQVQDPRNLGAVLRTADATGVHGVVLPKHHSVGLTAAVAKSAMGGVEHVPVAREANLVHVLEVLEGGVGVGDGGRAPGRGASLGGRPVRPPVPGARGRGRGTPTPGGQDLRPAPEPADAGEHRVAERVGGGRRAFATRWSGSGPPGGRRDG